MDSVFCKVGSLRPLVPASQGRPWEGPCDASQSVQATPRSLQICACRSPPPPSSQLTSPPAEEGTPKQGHGTIFPSFNPLTLLSSQAAIPAPLKFLWFNKTHQQAAESDHDPWATGCRGRGEESILVNHADVGNEKIWEVAQFELQLNDISGVMEKQEISDRSNGDAHGQKDTPDDLNRHVHDEDISKTVILNEFKEGDVADNLPRRPKSSDNSDSSSLPLRRERSWISRIANIKDFWPDPKNFLRRSTTTQSQTSTSSPGNLETGWQTGQSSEANNGACALDGALPCSLEVPYTKVLHTKESFSKFLQDASLYEMKVFAQLVFLCDAAYMIPGIQPGQLMKYHHLRLVTSSLDKKAEAESKAKEGGSSKAPSTSGKVSVGNGSVKSNVETSQFNLRAQSAPNPVRSSKAAQTKAVHIGTPCRSEGLKPATLLQTDHEQGQCISSPELSEGDKTLDVVSLVAVAPIAATIHAEEGSKLGIAKDLQSPRSCPCEWFVCDEPSTYTRMFVIQGSESLASWQTNLFFEPAKFEEMDVFVHRGIYEAANVLYDEVFPEVLAHISTHGDLARARFTGHSLGGSLATLLALMFQIRGVLPGKAILPVITFGSPCIMCGGDYLLRKLKLPKNHIQSVMMHRDVVPRAFACDYPDHVAEVLKRLNGRFRDLPCLNNQKLLYAPMGQFVILQPDESAAPSHPLLPAGHGLYVLRHPVNGDDVKNAIELRGAQRAFLNMPHPLDILSDPGAYGFEGALARDHDPRSYTKAIHVVLKHEVKRLRRVQREQRRQLWLPLVLAESSSIYQKGLISSGANRSHSKTTRALASSISRTTRFFKQPVNLPLANHIGLSMCSRSSCGSHKGTFSRYRRLFAAQNVQLGMLLVLSLQLVNLECFSMLFVWI